jgi:hypothetical protein
MVKTAVIVLRNMARTSLFTQSKRGQADESTEKTIRR